MSLRTQQDRGEVIYSAELPPLPRGDDFGVVYLPFSSLRLVRGPRLVPDAPPVDPKAVFQVSDSSIDYTPYMLCKVSLLPRNILA